MDREHRQPQHQSASYRSVTLGGERATSDRKYPSNEIKTSKYTFATFAPLNLYEQLHKFGNVYFLLISTLMYLGEKTPLFVGTIKPASTLATLLAMMAVTGVMALIEDRKRVASDEDTNSQKARCIKGTTEETKHWRDIQVGDILLVKQDEEFPADIVPLYCSNAEGSCYVSTANLDGESNLKLKSALPAPQKALGGDHAGQDAVLKALPRLAGAVEAEAPKASIHSFLGRLMLSRPNASEEGLGPKQLLLRGTTLRNTAWCMGVVVYTGAETRMIMNSRAAPLKQSNLERTTNSVMLLVLVAQCFLALVSDVLYISCKDTYLSHWYLYPPHITLPQPVGYWLTFFVLYSNLMPISLYPTLEVCNAAQSYFITNDRKMCYDDKEGNRLVPAGVKSATLCQELGQVNYIFSDKTGTLTQNVMDLKRLLINDAVFGTVKDGERGFNGAADIRRARSNGNAAEAIDKLLRVLAVAHTVMVTRDAEGNDRFEAESPDESALVEAAAKLGWAFQGCSEGRTTVAVSEAASKAQGEAQESLPGRLGEQERVLGQSSTKTQEYRILATNQFDSTRKRMSVVVRHGKDHFLFCKGADNVMLEPKRVSSVPPRLQERLTKFAIEGLRTLVIAQKQLNDQEVTAWLREYQAAERRLEGRDEALAAVAEKIELGLEVVGATAIEDKLQDEVSVTIEKIRQAKINLWVLTGDKLETARTIGFSSKVLTNEMHIEELDRTEDYQQVSRDLKEKSKSMKQTADKGGKAALLITGAALEDVETDVALKQDLLNLASVCSIVIACRVSPLQKAQMVRVVREGIKPTPVTLAIGDGANDVPMIQEAQVGVGIAGREGCQAVNNSDFSIGQFQYLQRLLFVHGRWNYRRVCKFTLFTFWRNAVQVLMICYYTFISGYSGTSLFEDWIRMSFNFLCSFPIMATGCFDQDIGEKTALATPDLYVFGREGHDLNVSKMGQTLLSALAHSIILYVIMMFAFPSLDLYGVGDYYAFGTAAYTCLLVDVNLRVVFLNHTHNVYTVGSILLSFVLYVAYLIFYPCTRWVADLLTPNMYMVPARLAEVPMFWLCILTVPMSAMAFDVLISTVKTTFDYQARNLMHLRAEQWRSKDGEPPPSSAAAVYRPLMGESSHDGRAPRDVGLLAGGKRGGLNLSRFAQQEDTGLGCDPQGYLKRVAFVAGLLLGLLGIFAICASHSCQQIRIHYEGGSKLNRFDHLGTSQHEVFDRSDQCKSARDANETFCTLHVTVPETMKPPILIYYALGPFYQNYNDYLKSEVTKELMGYVVDESIRRNVCNEATRRDKKGRHIVPCGMKATSVFNDTFTVKDYNISKSGIAWPSDLSRYRNPPSYPKQDEVSWLYSRYPDIVSEEEGVKSEPFAVWMRPSALWRVWNPYGYLHNTTLQKGQNLTVAIKSTYPMSSPDGYKHLVLTTLGPLGGRNDLFGRLLLGCAVLCWGLFLFAFVRDFRDKMPCLRRG